MRLGATALTLLAASIALVGAPTVVAGPAAADTGTACKVDYAVNDWGSGFTATVTIGNVGASAMNGWRLTYSYTGNQTLQQGWNGAWSQSGKTVTVANLPWNGTVPANGSVSAGANFSYTGGNAKPTDFAVNGNPCDGTTPPPPPPPPGGPAPALQVSGNHLVDAAGKTVTLHGVNRSGAEFACIQGNGIFDGPVDAASVAAIRSWHVNAVRVPVNEDCWLGLSDVKPEYAGATYQKAIKDYVALLHDNGMVAILDLHWTHGQYTGNSAGCSDVNATCQKPMPDAQYAPAFWTSAATAFKGDNATVFDLLNEPYPDRATTNGWACLRDGGTCAGIPYQVAGMQSLVDAVRATGATNVIMLGGLAYANDLTQWLAYEPTDPQHNLAASWHSYNFNTCASSSCWDSQIAPVAAKVPLVAGELGENDCAHSYVDGLMSWLDQHDISYLAWTWNTWACTSGPSLITSYDGTPTAYGVGIRDHFASVATAATAPHIPAATLVQVTNFGANPSNLQMYEYVPATVKAKPAVLVALHYCTGSGPAFYSNTEYAKLADRYGFIVIYPSVTRSSKCFDVSSPQALKHSGGSDPVGVVSMVKYVVQHNNADANRVYAAGHSSGAMMTNVLLGDYPDVFKAGAAFMGVPFGCFATTDPSGWNSACAQGQITKTPQQWGDLVRAAYPGYTGPRPRMQLWHGTNDTTLYYHNFGEEIKQWTNVAGIGQTPTTTDHPQSTWTRTRYDLGNTVQVEGISVQGASHSLPVAGMAQYAVDFLGLTK